MQEPFHQAQRPVKPPLDPERRVGLLAAWGRYPILVAEALHQSGYRVSCLGVKHHADPALAEICDDFKWIGAAKLNQAIRFFHSRGISQATMAGKFHKVLIYHPWLWLRYLPDWKFVRTFYHHFFSGKYDRKDDTILGAIVAAFAAEGITFQPATDYAPKLLVASGHVAGPPPSNNEQRDIEFGWEIAKQIGRLDIGQSVCVKHRSVLAVEAIEGTDACIRRAGELCREGGFVVVKVSKPQQDMRFDVPTVGVGTLETMAAAGAKVLAIEGGRTILLDADAFRAVAAKKRITVVALADSGAAIEAA
jgi:hypothetical protein